MPQLLASGLLFESPNEPRYHHHDQQVHVAVSQTLNDSIICSLTLFDIEISSFKKKQKNIFNGIKISVIIVMEISVFIRNTHISNFELRYILII